MLNVECSLRFAHHDYTNLQQYSNLYENMQFVYFNEEEEEEKAQRNCTAHLVFATF